MAAVESGRSSVEQDMEVVRRMRATPRTPMKNTPYRGSDGGSTQRRRGLFQPSSPASSESSGGLGHMSPLTSSMESLNSIGSPTFSPNGHYVSETPMKTRSSTAKVISVRSSLFPALTKTPLRRSARCSPRTKDSPTIRQSVAAMQDIVCEIERTPRSSRCNLTGRFVAETITSPSSVGTPPSQRKSQHKDDHPQVMVIPPTPTTICSQANEQTLPVVSPDDFYGPKPINPASFYVPSNKPASIFHAPAAPRATLLIDTLSSRGRRVRRDSDASIRSNISVASKRQRSSSRSTSRTCKRQKSAIPGVWHAIKKPKKMDKRAPKPKPVLSPNTRVAKLKGKPEYKSKPEVCLFEEKPRNRIVGKRNEKTRQGIFDTFPSPLIKRKKLPTTPVKEPEPDTNKKFMKYGSYRKAVFKIDNMSLVYKNGNMRMKSPEKRRRLGVRKLLPQLDPVDFDMPEPETSQIQSNVEDILQQLTDGDVAPSTPQRAQRVEKYTDEQLLEILESPSTTVKLVRASPKKVNEIQSSPQRSLARNLSGLQLTDDSTCVPLNGLLTSSSNILNDGDYLENDQENAGGTKLFPVFDPSTWKATSALTDLSNTPKKLRKKKAMVADDQYLLDAGQKSVAIVKCKECGVMYQAGDFLDEMAHSNFHNHLTDLSFMGWKDERVVSRFRDGRVVMVLPTDPKPWLEKARKAVGVVDLELGFSENYLQWTPDKKVLLFICEKMKQVIGCLVAEKCTQGFRMYPPVDGVELDTCARDATPCKVGVSRIWSAVHRRRQRVASRLFQSICRVAGDIQADDVAFSIPSPDGKMLARALVNRLDFKVYGFLSA